MMHFLLELVLWLLLAFFIGAIVGCLFSRLFGGGEKEAGGAVGTGVAGAAAGAASVTAAKAAADDAARREAEAMTVRKKAEEEAEAAARKAEEEARRKAEEEAARKKAEAEAAARKAEEEARRKAEEEAARKKAEAEAARKAEEEARRKAEEEAARKKAEAEAAARKAEEEAAAEATKPWGLAGPIGGKADNLTRIKGIGSKINQILNEMGIYHFSQIAAWTEKEIEEVDEKLKFKGRIVREKWVEQAKVLAEGGETEFSKRVDDGEVPTSHTHETPPDADGKTS